MIFTTVHFKTLKALVTNMLRYKSAVGPWFTGRQGETGVKIVQKKMAQYL